MLLKVAAEHGIRLPPELAMIGKTLLNLDQIGHTLAPDFDPNAAIRRHAGEITEQRVLRDLWLGSLFGTAGGMRNFVPQLPGRVNRTLGRPGALVLSNRHSQPVAAESDDQLRDRASVPAYLRLDGLAAVEGARARAIRTIVADKPPETRLGGRVDETHPVEPV